LSGEVFQALFERIGSAGSGLRGKETRGFRRLLAPSGATLRAACGRLSRSARLRLLGLVKVLLEWTLVTLACNLKRLFHVGARLGRA
jgi:hypothetical protein